MNNMGECQHQHNKNAINGLRGLLSAHILVCYQIFFMYSILYDLFFLLQIFHYVWSWTFGKVKLNGSMEISTFLILSGYGLTLAYGSENKEKKLQHPWKFYLKRIAR